MRTLRRSVVVAALVAAVIGLSYPVLTAQAQKKEDPAGVVVFEVYQDKSKEYRFRLKAGDKSLAISGKGYETKDEVMKVIDAIKKEAPKAKVVEEKK